VRASSCVRRTETGTTLAKHTILLLHFNGEFFKIGAPRDGGAEDGVLHRTKDIDSAFFEAHLTKYLG